MDILLLEDDKVLAETMQDALVENGFGCRIALTGNAALQESFKKRPDLYLLDINVPGILGINLLEELRNSGDKTPAIFITSLGDEASVLKGYQSGCDDYIRKPFTIAELVARIKALMRRTYGATDDRIVLSESIVFDMSANELYIDKEAVRLPKKEGELLAFFCKNRGKIVTKDEMIEALWSDRYPSDTVIRVHINNIKKLIGAQRLVNIKSVGYRLENI